MEEKYNYNIIIGELCFSWDENKNSINKIKHKISFEEACTRRCFPCGQNTIFLILKRILM